MRTYQARVWVSGWSWQEIEANDATDVVEKAETQARENLDELVKLEETETDIGSIKVIVDDYDDTNDNRKDSK